MLKPFNYNHTCFLLGDLSFFYLILAGVNWQSVGGPERMAMGVWVVGGLVVTWSYSSHLTSLLAVRRIPQSIQTVRALIDDPSLNLILTPNTIITTTLAVS